MFMKVIRKLFFLITVILVGSWVYRNNYEVRAATNDSISTLKDYFIRSRSSNTTATSSSGEKTWMNPTATVYLNVKNNQEYNAASQEAIAAWNKTGVFKFKQTNNRSNAQIIISEMNSDQTSAAGITSTIYNPMTKHLLRANIRLNSYYLQNPSYNYSFNRVVNTIEHELGHAIGLSHTNRASVMYPTGSYYAILPNDITRVKSLYNS